jgi:membrane associated rhomboid family serine protease
MNRPMYQRPSFYFPPLRDTPGVMGLILGCVAFFLFEFIAGAAHLGVSLVDVYAWQISPDWVSTLRLWQPLTYPFVHGEGGFISLLFDCLLLYFFAGSLERAWGTARFLIFFFLSSVLNGSIILLLSLRNGFEPELTGLGPGIWLTVTVAFATINPFAQIYLMMMFPIQARWIAWITIALDIFLYNGYYGGPIPGVLATAALTAFAYVFTSRDFRASFGGFGGGSGPRGPSLKERIERWQQRRRMRQWQKRVSKIDRPEDLFKDK